MQVVRDAREVGSPARRGSAHRRVEWRLTIGPRRGTCYGLSAAIGKTGAAVGTQAFTPIQNHLGKK